MLYKIIVKTEGIKRKEQKIKTHDISLGFSSKIDEDDFKSRARESLSVNMKRSNKAVIMVFKAYQNDETISIDKLPTYTWSI